MTATITQMHVPYVDLAGQHRPLRAELLEAVGRVIDSGQFIFGPQVEAFERRFAELCGVKHAVGVSNGTDALVLSLRALGIGPGDEVITAPNSFIATASAIALVGATPVFADVGPGMNLDPRKVEAAITDKTRAILPVHLTGRAADMSAILEIAQRHKLLVVEDAAQAVLAEHRGRRVGSFGHCAAFSLHPLKTLSACGDAGVITTDDAGLAHRLRTLRNLGLPTRDDCVCFSGNCRLDTVQAAMLLVKLDRLERWTEDRRANARFYHEALADLPAITLPPMDPGAVWHTFVIQADDRDALRAFLAEHGVGSAIHYPVPIHLQTAAAHLDYRAGAFPVAEAQARRILSLPVYPELTREQLEHVADTIRRFYATRK